jgi:inner membrane protein
VDPLTQGVLGAALPQAASDKETVALAGLLGFLAGMSPDLDVLIRSAEDPLLFLEYHRQFTHSLIFIPFGGFLCAAFFYLMLTRCRKLGFAKTYTWCTLGYATHALLDACTTYGTMLFWPFSDARIAWNTISIIDPLFTLPILVLVVGAGLAKRPALAKIALCWGLFYMSLGAWQRNEAQQMGWAIAQERGHSPIRLEAKPSFANILVWKVVYETSDKFYIDAVRTGPFPQVFAGDSLNKLNIDRDLPWLDNQSQQALDVERFRWFSNGFVAVDPKQPNRVIDIRYSMVPNEINPLWSIELHPGADDDKHANYLTHRDMSEQSTAKFKRMLFGESTR